MGWGQSCEGGSRRGARLESGLCNPRAGHTGEKRKETHLLLLSPLSAVLSFPRASFLRFVLRKPHSLLLLKQQQKLPEKLKSFRVVDCYTWCGESNSPAGDPSETEQLCRAFSQKQRSGGGLALPVCLPHCTEIPGDSSGDTGSMPLCTPTLGNHASHLALDWKPCSEISVRTPVGYWSGSSTRSESSKSEKAGLRKKTRVENTCLCIHTVITKKDRQT